MTEKQAVLNTYDLWVWLFNIRGIVEFIKELPKGTEPIEEVHIDTSIRRNYV